MQKALEIFDKEKPEYIILLGDLLYHGPRNQLPEGYNPMNVAQALNKRKEQIIAVRGNCDAEVDQMLLEFPILSEYTIILYNNRKIFSTHGHIYNENNKPVLKDNDILISGHTHIPVAKKADNIYILNPGSIAIPKENHPQTYGVLNENAFEIKNLDGNVYMSIEI